MNYTPHSHLTNSELILAVCNTEGASSLELELMERLQAADLEAEGFECSLEDAYAEGYAAGVRDRLKSA